MTFTEGLAELNTTLGDDDNFTFTPEEKTRALKEAWRDRYVVQNITFPFTYDSAVQAYDTTGVTAVNRLEYSTADTWGLPLSSDMWEFADDQIVISQDARYLLPTGCTISVKGRYKLLTTDDISDSSTNMIEYVLAIAHYNTLKLLGAKKTNRFIKNDTNMNEIIALRRDLQTDILQKRQSLARNFERA